jgi:hypothetical protein
MDEDQIAPDNDDISSELENYDFSQPDGGISQQTAEPEDLNVQDESNQNPDSEQSEELNSNQSNGDEMTDEERKEHNRTFAEQRLAAKREMEVADTAFKQSLNQQIQEKFVGQLDESKYEQIAEEEGQSVADMRRQLDEMQLRDRQREGEAKLAELEQLQMNVGMDLVHAQNSIPMFNPNDKANFREDLLIDAQRSWAQENAILHRDDNGNVFIVGVQPGAPSPYQYLNEKAGFYESLMKESALRGQEDAARNRSRAEPESSAQMPTGNSSTLNDLEERIGNIPLA